MAGSTSKSKATSAKPGADAKDAALLHLLVAKALDRASAAVEKSAKAGAGGSLPKISAGQYPVSLSVMIEGDLVAEAGSPGGAAVTRVTAGAAEILAGVLSQFPAAQRHNLVAKAAKRVKSATEDGEGGVRTTVRTLVREIGTIVDEAARAAGLVEESQSRPRAGAIKGTPGVRVEGTIGQHLLAMALDSTEPSARVGKAGR